MSSQYGELRSTNGWDRFGCLGHPSEFQRVSHLSFVTAATSLNGSQPNFAWCLAISWLVHYIYIFGDSCPITEFCQVQNSLCVQVLRSPILAPLLHGTRVVGIRQTAALSRGCHLYLAGWPSHWALAHILVLSQLNICLVMIYGIHCNSFCSSWIVNAIFIAKQLQEWKVRNSILYLCIWKKTFDTNRVPREVIRCTMHKLGVDDWLVSAAMSMYVVREQLEQSMVTVIILR